MSVDFAEPSPTQPRTPSSRPDVPVTVGPGDGDDHSVKAFDDDDGPSFSDLLDIINPLQHIPVINTIYRELTGDDEGAVADVVGGALFGGVIGMVAAVADVFVEGTTGKRVGENVVALFKDDDDSSTAVAQADGGKAEGGKDAAQATSPQAGESASSLFSIPAAGAGAANAAAAVQEPVKAGDYLIFGGPVAAAARPQVSTTPLPAKATSAYNATARRTSVSSGPKQQGDYLVFGAGDSATGLSATKAPTSATPIHLIEGDKAPSPKPEASSSSETRTEATSRAWPVPPRTGPATPQHVLPPPTTGPGALPGGRSLALSQSGAAMGANDADSSGWFVNAFNQAMDKYERSLRLQKDKDSSGAADTSNQPLN